MYHFLKSCGLKLFVAAILSLPRVVLASAAEFQPLGDLYGPDSQYSWGSDVSGDGSTVAGTSRNPSVNGQLAPIRWTRSSGMTALANAYFGQGTAISRDGTAIVGGAQLESSGDSLAFRWTAADGLLILGDLPGAEARSMAWDVSGDGAVVVGVGRSSRGDEAFRWTREGGMRGLSETAIDPRTQSRATAVSSDGYVVAGFSALPDEASQAFRWTSDAGLVSLAEAHGWLGASYQASGINSDGSVLVGSMSLADRTEAFRWTAAAGIVGLGDLPGGGLSFSEAQDVSADGSIVVGYGDVGGGPYRPHEEAFIWDAVNGMRNLKSVLEEHGLDLSGWRLAGATGVSDDGQVIVGWGFNPSGHHEAWRAVLPIPEPAGVVLVWVAALVLACRKHANGRRWEIERKHSGPTL